METYPVTWLTEKVDICDANHFLCQETLIMIKSGSRIAILATKGCVSEGSKSVTYIQNSEFPGLIVISYSKYCDTSLCNNIKDLSQIWKPQEEIPGALEGGREVLREHHGQLLLSFPPVSNMSTSVHCPTCVALGSCFNVTSLPCPRGINGCYAGRIMFSGEGIDTLVEVKGCSSMTHCELMNGFSMIGTLSISEVCPHPSLVQRSTESGAPWLCLPVRGLQLLTPLLGLLAHLL
ncbi:testis-expressed protein 101 [Perognathus longimembris pacificus]|uniref:testis-expressed protein 101 n=1 Tax=Perognathus longimembris pacificus TaxID=214514 RepID=UPI0020195679|nr:testis-expressed protein 101 [Perognathus longimembris pacificus]